MVANISTQSRSNMTAGVLHIFPSQFKFYNRIVYHRLVFKKSQHSKKWTSLTTVRWLLQYTHISENSSVLFMISHLTLIQNNELCTDSVSILLSYHKYQPYHLLMARISPNFECQFIRSFLQPSSCNV